MFSLFRKFFKSSTPKNSTPEKYFSDAFYRRHNHARQTHLASLHLGLAGKKVLEAGAGIGDHSLFFMSRKCSLTATDARRENLEIIKQRYPSVKTLALDMDNPPADFSTYEIVYCYGLLYHLSSPAEAIKFMAAHCTEMLLLETCVSYGDNDALNAITEDGSNPTQSFSGKGCRPTRLWVYNRLKENFPFVYLPLTQPQHEEFPLDWETKPEKGTLFRAVFIASKHPVINPLLTEELIRVHQPM